MIEPAPGLRVALAQINPTVGDLDGNAALIAEWIDRAREAGADLVVFPELCLPGYPAEDLYLKRHFLAANAAALERARRPCGRDRRAGRLRRAGRRTRASGRPTPRGSSPQLGRPARRRARSSRLPQEPAPQLRRLRRGPLLRARREPLAVEIDGVALGLTICEDLWEPGRPPRSRSNVGARLILNPSGSPYLRGKGPTGSGCSPSGLASTACRSRSATWSAARTSSSSTATASSSTRRARCRAGAAVRAGPAALGARRERPHRRASRLRDLDEVYAALGSGSATTRKNGFERVRRPLRWDRLGPGRAARRRRARPEQLSCVVMPSPHSSPDTQADARAIARNLGAELIELPIATAMAAYDQTSPDTGAPPGWRPRTSRRGSAATC